MYYQDFQQSHRQYSSHGQFDDRPYSGYASAQNPQLSEAPVNIVLDEYNSDLNFVIDRDGITGSSLHQDGFEYLWAGARATHGVRSGKVCFEVTVLEKLPALMPETETTPHVVRVGWSVDAANLQVGEDHLSYGFGGTGKASVNNKFFDYGEPFSSKDTITCYIDLDANPRAILFAKNGHYLGVAFRLGSETIDQVFFPHITVKNMRVALNFGSQNSFFPPLQGFSFMSSLPVHYLERGTIGPATRQDCEIIMMVGLPGAGKTVWAMKYAKEHPEKKYNILGTNTIMDKMKVMGLMRKRNYHGRWDALIKQATDILNKTFKIAERKNRNYILDQTNVYFTARRRKMNNFQGYHKIAAVVVNTNEVLKQRTEMREKEEGKIVPESAVCEMKANFSLPEVGSTFEDVWFIEEDRENSERLVAEFQQEGKEFKEREKKRKPEEGTEQWGNAASGVKRACPEQLGVSSSHQRGPPSSGPNLGYQGHYTCNIGEPRGAPNQESYHGPPPGTYGAKREPYQRYDNNRSSQGDYGPQRPSGPPPVGPGRYNEYGPSYGLNDHYGNLSGYGSYNQGYSDFQKPRLNERSYAEAPPQHVGYADQRSSYSATEGRSGYETTRQSATGYGAYGSSQSGYSYDGHDQYYNKYSAPSVNSAQQRYGDPSRGQPQDNYGGLYHGYGGGY